MSPPTIPPFVPSPGQLQTANIIIEALRQSNYDAGIASFENEWKDFDVRIYRYSIVVGSKKRNRSWLYAYHFEKTITFYIIGIKPPQNSRDGGDNFNLAEPDALEQISNYITDVVNNDWYKYPWI